jgi:hypothetical protein
MSNFPPGTAATLLRVELALTKPVRAALSEFTEEGNTDSLHVYAGAARLVESEPLYRQPVRGEGRIEERYTLQAKVSSLETALTKSAVKLLYINDQVELQERAQGAKRLLMKPSNPRDLRQITGLIGKHLPNEKASMGLDQYLYVDFSDEILAKNALQLHVAMVNFSEKSNNPSTRNGFHVDRPELRRLPLIIPENVPRPKDNASY